MLDKLKSKNKSKSKDKSKSHNFEGLPARQAAVKLLRTVLQDGKPLDDVIGRYGNRGPMHELEQRDRAFARNISATALRHHGEIVHVLNQFLEKPLPDKCGSLREILLAASTQLLFLNAAPHAVINLAVRQCQLDRPARRFDKLANAVLRRVKNEGPKILEGQDAILLNTPKWMFDRWATAYGEDLARRIATANLSEAALDLTVKSDPESWADRLGGIALPNGTVRLLHKGRVDKIDGFDKGEWWVQDAAASLPARLFGDVRGMRIADLCAAPGGKTAQLAHAGASVVAVDTSPVRLDRLNENLARLKLQAETIEEDATKWLPRELFDGILLDAPCSATGTIRRHPDILHLKKAGDLIELVEIQRHMLTHALKMLKPGGVLVYCTCSLEPEEGYEQIINLLKNQEGVSLDPVGTDSVAGLTSVLDAGAIRTFPYHMEMEDPAMSGMDGFFAARLRKG